MPEPHKQSLEGQSTFGPPLPVDLSPDQVKAAVAERYGRVATSPQEKLGFPVGRQFAESVGYDPKALNRLPAGLGESFTGAGNPQPFVDPALGETLLDLGCGAGLDLALYAERIGPTGRLIGLDISAQMLAKAAANLATLGILNVDWLHAPSDAIPLPDNTVDLVTANGIFNLSPDKDAVMKDIARVLKPGGRTVFAEIVLVDELPTEVRRDVGDWFALAAHSSNKPCFAGSKPTDSAIPRYSGSAATREPDMNFLAAR